MQQLVKGVYSNGNPQDEKSARGRHGDSGDAVRGGSKVASHDSGCDQGCRGEEAGICAQCGSSHGEGEWHHQRCGHDGSVDESRDSRADDNRCDVVRTDAMTQKCVAEPDQEQNQRTVEWLSDDAACIESMNRKTRRKLRKAIEDVESYGCYEAWSESLDKRKADVCEVFSVPRINQHVDNQDGLHRGKNYDLVLGDDFLQPQHRKRVRDEICKEDPFCVTLCPPCTMFSQRRRSTNDPVVERKKLREAIILLNYAIEICEDRMKRGRYFLFEHPQGARSWKCKKMVELLNKPQVSEVVLDMCQYGMCDRVNGKPHRKSTRLVGNLHEDVMQGLHRRCNGEHEHQPLEGRVCLGGHWYNRTRLAQEYPDEFCKAVCRAILAQKNVCRCENGKLGLMTIWKFMRLRV